MSLIQEALERTKRTSFSQSTWGTAKPLGSGPAETNLEKELSRVHKDYAERRARYWKWGVGAGAFLCIAGLFFSLGGSFHRAKVPSEASSDVPVAPPAAITLRDSHRNVPFKLSGIMSRGGKAVALINGRIVGVGGGVSRGAIVTSIGDGEVFLDVRGKKVRLEL